MRSQSKVITTIIILFFFIVISQTVRASIQNSLALCAQLLIPSLFPFFIISGMLFDFGIDLIFPPSLCCFLISLFCGFPVGTKSVCDSYTHENLTKSQANMLLLCTANASPAFVVVALGETILQNKTLGYLFFLCQTINAILLYLLFVPKSKKTKAKAISKNVVSSLIDNAKSATEQILFVCSITIVFGIIFDIAALVLKGNLIKLSSLIELLHGILILDKSDLTIIGTALGFSGLAVISQCIFFIKKTDLEIKYLILGKIQSAATLPLFINVFLVPHIRQKILCLSIIVLTNFVIMCIIKSKGCETKDDFFKKHRKMLCILRKSNKSCI